MTDEDGAAMFIARCPVSCETLRQLTVFVDMVREESRRQNLVAESTMGVVWERHMLDSAQLVTLAPPDAPSWLDVGSGAGLPGVVTALLTSATHVLVEPRRRRADFLGHVVSSLGIGNRVEIIQARVERLVRGPVSVITARAYASLTRTLATTRHLSDHDTVWLLHKGRTVAEEVATARRDWAGEFATIPSVTDSDAAIVRVSGLQAETQP